MAELGKTDCVGRIHFDYFLRVGFRFKSTRCPIGSGTGTASIAGVNVVKYNYLRYLFDVVVMFAFCFCFCSSLVGMDVKIIKRALNDG